MLEELRNDLVEYYNAHPATGNNPIIENMKPLNTGWASDVYAFTLKYDEAGEVVRQHLILKAYTNTVDGKDRALKERHALFNLRAARFPVPGVADVEIEPDHIGRPFIIMEQIDGELMADALNRADERERHELVRLFVGLMTDLHEMGAKVLVPSMKPVGDYTLVNREIYILRDIISRNGYAEFAPVVDWLYERRKTVSGQSAVITHRDFHPWNILLTENRLPYVIDWGWQVSDPRFDLAWTLTLLQRSGFGDLRDAVLAEYERVTGGPVEHLDYFEVLVSVRWLVNTAHAIRSGDALHSESSAAFQMAMVEPARAALDLIAAGTGLELPSAQDVLYGGPVKTDD